MAYFRGGEGFMDPEEFKEKYKTNCKQFHPLSYLDKVSEEDREMYDDVEILTARNHRPGKHTAAFNKFHDLTGLRHQTKTASIRKKVISSLLRYMDEKIQEGKDIELWDAIWKGAKRGDAKLLDMVLNRVVGPVKQDISIDASEDVTFQFKPAKHNLDRKEQNLENKEKNDGSSSI